MSIYYDGSGNITYSVNTISSIVNYKYNPPNFQFSISSFIFNDLTISNYLSSFGTISSFVYVPLQLYKNDNTSNRMLSTFFRGFIDIDGSITCNKFFNNIPVNNFNLLLTIGDTINTLSSIIYRIPNYQPQINTLSSLIYNIPNYQPQINTLSSLIYNIPNQINYQPQINTLSSLIYNIPNYQPQINTISSLIYNIPNQINYQPQINTLSSLIYKIPNQLNYQLQINTLSSLIYNVPLLSSNNIWSGIQSFSKPIYQNLNNNLVLNIGSGNLLNNSSGYGNVVVGFNSVKVANNNSNISFGSYNLNSITSGNNVVVGEYCFYSATTGDNCCALGSSVFYKCVIGRNNSGIGYEAGYYMLGSFNTCVGGSTGQINSDTSTYNNSTAIGYGSIINSSNQIMLGTVNETVYIPNALIMAGTNILTTISSSINNILPTIDNKILSSITTFKASNNTFSGVNKFGDNGILFRDTNHFVGSHSPIIDGPQLYGYLGVDIGYSYPSKTAKLIISADGLTMGTATLGNSIWNYLSTITSNIQDQINTLTSNINTRLAYYLSDSPNTNKIYYANGRIGLRNQVWTINTNKSFYKPDFGADQFIIYNQPTDGLGPLIKLVPGDQAEGQRVTIWNNSGTVLTVFYASSNVNTSLDNGKFIGYSYARPTAEIIIQNTQSVTMISNYYNWVVLSFNAQ